MVNKTQINFTQPPEKWGGELYRLIGQLMDAVNVDIEERLRAAEDQIEKNKNGITVLRRELI